MTMDRTENSRSRDEKYTFDEGIDEEDILADEYIKKPYDPTKIQV
ncbi:unnamed protein product, partial [marine sediment metagenome]